MGETARARTDIPEWSIHDRLRKSLEHSEVPPAEMAEYLEVHRNTVSNWIHGHARPRPSDMKLWALRTGVPYEWIAHGIVPKTRPGGRATDEAKLPHLDSNQEPSDSRLDAPRRAEITALTKKVEFRRALGRTGEARSTRSPIVTKP